jgi:hypothetical protein
MRDVRCIICRSFSTSRTPFIPPISSPNHVNFPVQWTSPARISGFAELLVNVGRFILRRPVDWLASSFSARSYKRNHLLTYRADAVAAGLCSPRSVVGVLSAEVLETSVRLAIQRGFLAPGVSGPKIDTPEKFWSTIDAHTRQVPQTEPLRLLRRSSLVGHSVDPELPPLGYRADILNVYNVPEAVDSPSAVVVSDDRYQTVWSEIEGHGDHIADEFAGLFGRSFPIRR